MDKSKKVKLSKALSYILRHGAKKHGFMVFEGGWVYLDDVLEWLNRREKNSVKRRDVYYVVKHNEKNRFSIKENLIRANQGHSFPVNLQLKERTPPELLYHGTHEKVKNKILEKGILRMKRHHVHLSYNLLTAKKVGARRGK